VIEVLNLYHMCKTFGQLPHRGGVLDQPARLMYVLEGVMAAELEAEQLRQQRERKAAERARNR
jgi:hypothetical protein